LSPRGELGGRRARRRGMSWGSFSEWPGNFKGSAHKGVGINRGEETTKEKSLKRKTSSRVAVLLVSAGQSRGRIKNVIWPAQKIAKNELDSDLRKCEGTGSYVGGEPTTEEVSKLHKSERISRQVREDDDRATHNTAHETSIH